MIQLIAFIIFIVSLIMVAFILVRKMPALAGLPKNGHHGVRKHSLIADAEKRIREFHFHFFSKQMLLHTILSKFRILTLRMERKIDTLLHGIRKKAQELDKQVKKKK